MDKTDLLLRTGAGAVVLASLFGLLFDPTHSDGQRLTAVAETASKSVTASSAASGNMRLKQEAAALGQQPIFVMSTGAGAFTDKPIQIYGISISAGRKAVLVAIDGGPPAWMRPGDTSGEVRLLNVEVGGARFETPLGDRVINLNDQSAASPAPTNPNGPQGG